MGIGSEGGYQREDEEEEQREERRREEDDHAEFSFKTSLRICAFANFGRRLDARLFIPAALRLASSTSLFAHLIGRRPLALPRRERRFALCRMIIYPNALPSSTILHGLTSARTARIKSRRYLYFFHASSPLASLYPLLWPSRSFSLSLLPQVSILISAEYTPSRRCRRRRRRRRRHPCRCSAGLYAAGRVGWTSRREGEVRRRRRWRRGKVEGDVGGI